jgi:hypothetical protein
MRAHIQEASFTVRSRVTPGVAFSGRSKRNDRTNTSQLGAHKVPFVKRDLEKLQWPQGFNVEAFWAYAARL